MCLRVCVFVCLRVCASVCLCGGGWCEEVSDPAVYCSRLVSPPVYPRMHSALQIPNARNIKAPIMLNRSVEQPGIAIVQAQGLQQRLLRGIQRPAVTRKECTTMCQMSRAPAAKLWRVLRGPMLRQLLFSGS